MKIKCNNNYKFKFVKNKCHVKFGYLNQSWQKASYDISYLNICLIIVTTQACQNPTFAPRFSCLCLFSRFLLGFCELPLEKCREKHQVALCGRLMVTKRLKLSLLGFATQQVAATGTTSTNTVCFTSSRFTGHPVFIEPEDGAQSGFLHWGESTPGKVEEVQTLSWAELPVSWCLLCVCSVCVKHQNEWTNTFS